MFLPKEFPDGKGLLLDYKDNKYMHKTNEYDYEKVFRRGGKFFGKVGNAMICSFIQWIIVVYWSRYVKTLSCPVEMALHRMIMIRRY